MKAIVLTRYGSPDVLRLEEVAKPEPRDDEVLVKVHATAVNDWDWSFVRGKPYIYRLMFGLVRPRVAILGVEVAGIVEATGNHVAKFQPGYHVYGDISEAGFGGFAEYVCVSEDALSRKPPGMTFEQAAALPHAAMLALQGLVDLGRIRQGESVLINGAGGGVGTIGVQIAKQFGAEVTGVDSALKLDMLRSMGFDHVIDYQREDFTRNGQLYDGAAQVLGRSRP
ncbi:MAG: NAD(P)-dependent alcohol dehydrogenase [Rhodothermales bacterium]